MRFTKPLDEILGRRSKVAILRFLILTGIRTTGRDLARRVGLDHKTCIDALADLVRSDIVRRNVAGRAWVYSLNDGFPILDDVLIPLFRWERELPDRFAEDLRKEFKPHALSVFLFGSTAKKTDEAESDIDLLVVTRDRAGTRALEEREDATLRLIKKYSRVPMWIFMDVKEFRKKYRENDGFLSEILRSGRRLAGLRVLEVLDYGRPKSRHANRRTQRIPGAMEKGPRPIQDDEGGSRPG